MGWAMTDETELIDYGNIPDTYCTGIARIERLGDGCFRFVLYCEEHPERGVARRVKVASLVCSAAIVPRALKQTAAALLSVEEITDDMPPAALLRVM